MAERLVFFDPPGLASLTGCGALLGNLPLPATLDDQVRADQPERVCALLRDGAAVAWCSLWWLKSQPYTWGSGDTAARQHLGVIGHYAAMGESGPRLLDYACEHLGRAGCDLAIGPMDGNTWRRYRFIVERGSEPPFFLEPDNPDDYPGHFRTAGFEVLASYTSALATDLARRDDRAREPAARLAAAGVVISSLDLARFDAVLDDIYELSVESFRDNFLYTPIDRAEFRARYAQVRPVLRPGLVLLARHGAELVGYIFAVPDVLARQRGAGGGSGGGGGGAGGGSGGDTIVVKTLAVRPGWRNIGLGSVLMDRCHQAAHGLGFRRAIHALMHEHNRSRRLSDRWARTFRRYALFVRRLTPGGQPSRSGAAA